VYSLIFAVSIFLHTKRQSQRAASQPQTKVSKVLGRRGHIYIYCNRFDQCVASNSFVNTNTGWQPYHNLWADCLEDVVASTSHTPMGLHGLLQGQLYLFTGNNRRETVFSMQSMPTKSMEILGSMLPDNAVVNLHPQQWEVFSVGSVQRSYLKPMIQFWVLGRR
jgi:hypothetical protein